MTAGPWESRLAFELWWKAHVIAFNRLSVSDPEEWERVAQAIEAFNARQAK